MREGWATSNLGDVVQPVDSVDPTKAPTKRFRYVDVSSVSNETFEIIGATELLGRDAPSRARRKIMSGDIIFATIRPTLKRIAIVPPDLDGEVCSTGYFVFRPKSFLHHRFLFYYLFTEPFSNAMNELQTGASYPAVNDTQVRQQEISYPPLPEQQRIVAVLDEALAGLTTASANAEKNLKNARELFESYLGITLGQRDERWPVQRLEEIVDESCSLSYGIVQPGDELPDGLPIVRPVDMNTKIIQVDGLKRIDASLAKAYSRTKLQGGELLLCVRGTTGAVSIAADELSGANVTRGIVPILFNASLLTQRFGYYALRSARVQRQIREKTYGTALMQINIRDLRNLLIPAPPLTEQEGIATRLDTLSQEASRLEEIYQSKLNNLQTLKQALLQAAFSGELTSPPSQAIKEAAE